MSLDERAQRIVDTAIELAEKDGFAAVRLRDVAAKAEVALGTVYKRFSSKEEILIAALEQQSDVLLENLAKIKQPGKTPRERVVHLYELMTLGMTARPNLARALIRSIAAGSATVNEQVDSFHALVNGLTTTAIRGHSPEDWGGESTEFEAFAASAIEQVWFTALVGWAGELQDTEGVVREIDQLCRLIFEPKTVDRKTEE